MHSLKEAIDAFFKLLFKTTLKDYLKQDSNAVYSDV